MRIGYTNAFIRQFKHLPKALQEEALDAIDEFQNSKNHQRLKVHKLQGAFKGLWAFSVNFRIRIVFEYQEPRVAVLHTIGDHDIYRA